MVAAMAHPPGHAQPDRQPASPARPNPAPAKPLDALAPAGNRAIATLLQPAPVPGGPARAPAPGPGAGPAPAQPAVQRQPAAPADPFEVLATGRPPSPAEAKTLLDRYEALGPAERDAVVRRFHQVGLAASGVERLLAALDPAERKARRALLSDIGERVQRLTVERATGKTLQQLGAEQGAFMAGTAATEAQAKVVEEAERTHTAPRPVEAHDIAVAHDQQTKRASTVEAAPTNAWDALDAATKENWNRRAAAVISRVVAACRRQAPELGITAANLKWSPREIAMRGRNIYALAGDPISFGMSFVETAEIDANYVVRTVVHESAGHPDFGDRRGSYEAKIYEEAHRQVPSLGQPWDTSEEFTTFGYIGTEIYAALREMPFEVPLSREDAKRGVGVGAHPVPNISNKIGLLKAKFKPGLAEALLQGLYERFKIDPRVSASSLAVFERLADDYFPGALKGVPDRGPHAELEAGVAGGVAQSGGQTVAVGHLDVKVALRWADTAVSAGLRLDVPFERGSIVRVGLQGGVETRLFRSLYGELHGGFAVGVSSDAPTNLTAGAGLSADFGSVQLGVVYDYLRAADQSHPDAHRALLRLGFRFGGGGG
jgi:hypothetical protein